jgi:acetyl esterase/lipase
VLRSAERLTGGLNVLGKRSQLELYRLDGDSATLEHAYPGIDFAVYGNLSWSPSGARLLAVGRPTRDAAGQPIDYGLNQSRGTRLYVVSVADGRLQDVAGADLGFGDPLDLTVLPMGWLGETPLAVASHAAGADMEAPPSVGPQSRLEYGDLRRTRFDVFAFPASGRVNLTAQAAGSVNRFLAVPARGTVYYVADGTLWRTTVGGTPERLLPEGAPTIVGFGVDRRYPEPAPATTYLERGNVQRVALTALVDGAMRRMVLDLLTGTLAPLAPPGQIIATAPDLATTVSKRTDNWRQELFLNRAQSTELAHFDIAPPGRAVAQPQRFTFTVDGHELTGWMLLPPGGDGAARLPAVVSVYGGAVYGGEPPTAARTDFGLPVLSAQLLAAAGYVVILPSTPLGMGADSDVMQQLADTVVAAVDALAARGIVDPARVGVMGQSFGGFSTAAILSRRSDRFAAGISLAGVYDFAGGYGLRSMTDMLGPDESVVPMETLLIESGQIHLNRPFWEAPEAYMRNSPIYHVATINSPLLLLHGDLDMSITGLVGAERLYNALQRAGKPAALVRYWGESHVVGSAPAMRDQWQRITTWFGRYLAPRQGERDDRPGSRQPAADGAVPAPPRE